MSSGERQSPPSPARPANRRAPRPRPASPNGSATDRGRWRADRRSLLPTYSEPSAPGERVRPMLVRPFCAFAETEFVQQGKPQHCERYCDGQRNGARLVVGAGQIEHHEQVEKCAGAEEREQKPDRHVAVMGAFRRDGEFRIGKRQVDDGTEPVTLELLGEEMA